jgi:hypothetical protein
VPESKNHAALLERLVAYVQTTMNQDHNLSVLDDLSAELGRDKPPCLGGFRPDLYATNPSRSTTIVGEAKTRGDLETDHSKAQYYAYAQHLRTCANPTMILAVPWQLRIRAKVLLRYIIEEIDAQSIQCLVIDDVQEIPT